MKCFTISELGFHNNNYNVIINKAEDGVKIVDSGIVQHKHYYFLCATTESLDTYFINLFRNILLLASFFYINLAINKSYKGGVSLPQHYHALSNARL